MLRPTKANETVQLDGRRSTASPRRVTTDGDAPTTSTDGTQVILTFSETFSTSDPDHTVEIGGGGNVASTSAARAAGTKGRTRPQHLLTDFLAPPEQLGTALHPSDLPIKTLPGLFCWLLAILLLAGPAEAQQPPAQVGGELPEKAVRQIKAMLTTKAQRTSAQRKVSSQLLDAARSVQLPETAGSAQQPPAPAVSARQQAADADVDAERVMVDIRADVTPAVLTRIRELGGTVINSVPKYQAIRAQIPLRAVVMLAALDEIRTIRPADEARTRGQVSTLSPAARTRTADTPVTRKANTSEGDMAHRANSARRTHSVDGTGIGIGVISDGVRSLADRQASGRPARPGH